MSTQPLDGPREVRDKPPSALRTLLERLEELPADATAEQALDVLRPQRTPLFERARELAALPRVLTRDVYARLVQDVAGAPTLDALIDAYPHDFEPVPTNAWEMRASTREHLLAGWQRRETDWRTWNGVLYEVFLAKAVEGMRRTQIPDKRSEIEAVYHGASSVSPDQAVVSFEQAYRLADERADFAHCQALLEAGRSQAKYRGSRFSQSYRDRARYLQSRLLFIDALQKTNAYLKRTEPHEQFAAVVHRQTPQPWIFHMHATGGLGKTMFLRWKVARNLVLRRIPCAYVDFDEHALLTFVRHPLRLLGLIITQWTQQMTHTVFASAAAMLQRVETYEGWVPELLADLELMLKGANIQSELVIVLDTLEEPTLTQPDWLRHVIATLRMLHTQLPQLTLVLAGRYPLTAMLNEYEAVIYELPLFSSAEAGRYLALRGVGDADLQAAIIERAQAGNPATTAPPAGDAAPAEPASGSAAAATLNPFKLALMTELVLDQDGLTPDEVRALPDVDIAYLIERVILRIPSQPLRWMIRYGALSRRLTVPFLTEVLLPPLRAALRGESTDLHATHLSDDVRNYLDSKVTWQEDPALADTLNPQTLWEELAVFARERGWISVIPGDGTESALQLHPDVVRPVQVILSAEPVYRHLHEAARAFCLKRWGDAALTWTDRAMAATDAIFHTAAVDPVEARALWHRLLAEAGPAVRYRIAAEPTAPAYRMTQVRRDPDGSTREEERPLHPEWYAEAHVESARDRLYAAGVQFTLASGDWASCRIHVAAARAVEPAAVPQILAVLDTAAGQPSASAAAMTLEPLASTVPDGDRFWLHVHAATYWTLGKNDTRAETHWIEASRLVDRAKVGGLERAQIGLQLAALYGRQQRYSDAMDAYRRVDVLDTASKVVSQALEEEARLALSHHDLGRYQKVLAAVPTEGSLNVGLLELRRLVQTADTRELFIRVEHVRRRATLVEEQAETYVLEGDAHRWLLDYREALEAYSRAADIAAGQSGEGASDARVRELELYAFDMGDGSNAWRYLEEWSTADPRFSAHPSVQIVRAFLDFQAGKAQEPMELVGRLVEQGRPIERSRALLVALAFSAPKYLTALMTELSAAFEAVEPAQMFVEVLRILEHLPSIPLSGAYSPAVAAVRASPAANEEVPLEIPLQLLDLARVWQAGATDVDRQLYAALQALPTDRSPARAWYGLRLLDHYHAFERQAPLGYGDLLAEAAAAGISGTPLEAVLKARTALERIRAGDLAGAQRLADEAGQVWTHQPESTRLREVTRERLNVAEASARAQAAGQGAASQAAAKPPGVVRGGRTHASDPLFDLQRVELTESAMSALDQQLDKLSTRGATAALFNDWRSVERLMCDAILASTQGRTPASLQIVAGWRQASLPWEFAAPALGTRLMCRGTSERPRDRSEADEGRRSILVLKAHEAHASGASFDVSEAAESGFSIEDLYSEVAPELGLQALHDPHPKELQSIAVEMRPTVVHIVGQMWESGAGVSVDFMGLDTRALGWKGRPPGLGNTIDARRLARAFERQAPVVILDITAPENVTDVVQMLLLRNRFAAELLETGSVRAVLATGLTGAAEREAFSRALITSVAQNTTLAFLWDSLRSDDEPTDLVELVSQYGTALFAHDPYARIFSGPGRDGPAR